MNGTRCGHSGGDSKGVTPREGAIGSGRKKCAAWEMCLIIEQESDA